MANDYILDGRNFSELARIDGLVLIGFFAIFLYYTFGISRVPEEEAGRVEAIPMTKSIIFIGIGLAGLLFGAKWIVDGAVFIANQIGISEALVGLTIVAIGTSLPELAASAVAAFKKKADLAVGTGAHLLADGKHTRIGQGQEIEGFIKKVRDDKKIDLLLQKPGYLAIDALSQKIMDKLQRQGGFMAVTDKSPPKVIADHFGISKKTYKKAIGNLYKKRLISLEKNGIRLREKK